MYICGCIYTYSIDIWLFNTKYLQIAASKMDPNHFLMLVLLRFELFDYFKGSINKDQASNSPFMFLNKN